jgi:bacillolysin
MPHIYTAAAYLALSAALIPNLASAQDTGRIQKKEVGPDGQPTLIQFKAANRPSGVEGASLLREQLSLGTDEQMRPARLETDQLGFSHQKFNQYYKGVKIEHATYTVHARGGAVESLSGDYERVEKLNVTPSLSASDALNRALASVGARKYMWQDAAEEAGLKQSSSNAQATYLPQGELVIVRDGRVDAATGPLVLAWKFNIYAQVPVSRAYVYVDAHTGAVVLRDAIIKHATGGTATFATAYSGTRSLADETVTGGYHLKEYTRGNGIETYNMKKGTNYASAVDFIDADNNWTATEYNNANFDNVAGDAHFGAQATYDYWKAVHARNSYDNAGAKIKSYVHYSRSYENAYWDGVEMTYGDGASTFKPLTALDVCGHEIGHAVCENTANLTYSAESGALNEGFSDCWGASVEKFTVDKLGLTGKSTWDIGEEIMKAGGALRSMSNPNLYGQPAYYKGKSWASTTSPSSSNDYGGVHTNSGVLNYWYYLIATGKTGTNEAGAAFAVTGLGLTDAAKILFRTEDVYLSASSNYAATRTYSIQAATDLFGATSTQTQAVTNAWYAVGIGAAYGGGTTTPPTTTAYCASKGNSVSYEYIDYVKLGTIARTSTADGGYYDGTATGTSVAAGSSQSISYSAGFVGSAYTEYFKVYADWNQDGDFGDAGETIVSAAGSSSTAIRTSTFTVPSTAKTGKTRLRVVMSDASATTSCGTYSYGETEDYSLTVTGGTTIVAQGLTATAALDAGAELSLYPNPASELIQLSLSSGAELKSVEVVDARGATATIRYEGNGQLNVSSLAAGLYLLRASDGQNTFVKRFAKQ